MSRGPWPLVLAGCLAWSSCVTAPPSAGPRSSGREPAGKPLHRDEIPARATAETPASRPRLAGAAVPATAATDAPAGLGSGEAAPPAPAPSTPQERAAARLTPTRVERVRPHLPPGTELHGVSLLARADTVQGPLDALLVQRQSEGGVVATVLVLDASDALDEDDGLDAFSAFLPAL